MKNILLVMATSVVALSLSAQQSVSRYKTNNRNATEGIDAAVYNPAGMIWLRDGFHLEVGNQLGFGTKEVYDGLTGTTYTGKGGSAFDPTAIFILKKNNLAANFAFGASSGGGGSMPDGSPMVSMGAAGVALNMASQVNAALTSGGLPAQIVDPFTENLYGQDGGSLEEGALDLGFQANAAYKVNSWLSLSIGAKYMYRKDDYIKGNMAIYTNEQAITDFQNTLLGMGLPQEQVSATISQVPVVNGDVARIDANYTNNNYWVFSAGANIRPAENLLIAQTAYFGPSYTANMKLNELFLIDPALLPELENLLGMTFEDGAPYDRKIIPRYNLGIAYYVTKKLRFEADFYAQFRHSQDSEKKNEYRWGLGAEYQFSDMLNWGAGFKYQPVRRPQEDMSDIDFSNEFLWLASGFEVFFSERFSGVAAVEFGVPTSKREYTNEDVLVKSYKDKLNTSASFGIRYSF